MMQADRPTESMPAEVKDAVVRAGRQPAASGLDDTCAVASSVDATCNGTFGDYDLFAEIGHGGMGVVFKARQRSLNRVVALKMIRSAQLASKQEVQRFYTEAESAAHLDHPGIVPVYAAGEHQGRHYYSMAFVEGVSLQEMIANETVLPAAESAEVVRRVAEAIHYAHRRGVVHRDLKPANILLAESDAEGAMRLVGHGILRFEPKVADFGLAKKTEADSDLTGTGQILGTPSYMPPEQAAGESGPVSDVYSLGAVLYCLLIGRPPFRAANAVQTLQQVMHDEPVPPRQVNSTVPRDLETICLKCLQKSPGRRYATAGELAADLKRFRDGEPITARPVSSLERSYKWIQRHPAMAALAVAGLIMLMAAVALLVSRRYQGDLERLLYYRHVLAAHQAWRDGDIITAQRLLDDCRMHLRGWEWGYVDRLCRWGYVTTIKPPGLNEARLSAAGEKLWNVYAWDAVSGQEIIVLEGFASQVVGVQFGADGRELWTSCNDGTVNLWNLDTRQIARTVTSDAWILPKIAYSPDGSRVATGGLSPTWQEWMLADRASTIDADGEVRTWNIEAFRDAILKAHPNSVKGIRLSPDGQRLAAASDDGTIKLWDMSLGRPILDCKDGHRGPVFDVCFSPDGNRLASAGSDRTVRIWDVLTGRLILTLDGPQGHSYGVFGVVFHPDGRQIASAGGDRAVKIWNVGSGRETTVLRGHAGPATGIAFHPDGALLASSGSDGCIRLWKLGTGALVSEVHAHDEPIAALAFSPDGRQLASASHDRTVKIWKVSREKMTPVRILEGHAGKVYGVAFSRDGRLLASASHDGKCIVWNTLKGRIHNEYPRSAGPVFSAALHPDGSRLAIGGYDLAVANLDRGVVSELTGHVREVLSVAFSPDGGRLVSASQDGTLRVWNGARQTEIGRLDGHLAPVTSVAFSPAGDRVASASWDGSIRVWDPDQRQETLALKGQSGRAYGVAFSPDGRYLASANHDGTITIWGR